MTDQNFPQTHPREQAVFLEAIEIDAPQKRAHFLDQQCGSDVQLRVRVDALLAAYDTESILQPVPKIGDLVNQIRTDHTTIPTSAGGWEPPLPEELEPHLPGYRITALLGRGGMGAVYRGIQQSLDREVAIKLLPPELGANPEFAARFEREAKSMAKLNHPNIVQIYDFGKTTANHYFFAMEFVEGTDLQAYARSGNLSAADALVAVGQICDALQYAHDKGFVHRDIKPANIFLRNDGILKVGDFGLAKLIETGKTPRNEADISDLTMTGYALGTPNYIAPEQLEGGKEVDHRADLYSLGVMFYEMLTGELPRGTVKPPSQRIENLDVRIDDVVFKAMESKPEHRYQTASDLHADVEEIRSSTAIPSVPKAKGEKIPTRKRKKKKSFTFWFWIISSVIELGAVFYFFVVPHLPQAPSPALSGKLHASGKMAKGQNGGLIPVDIKEAGPWNDIIQITGKYRGAWAALRSDGTVISSSSSDFKPYTGIVRLGRRSGSTGNLFYIDNQGKIFSSNPNPALAKMIPPLPGRAVDIATHNQDGLILCKNGEAIPFGQSYINKTWFSPATSALSKVTQIAVGENTAAVLKRDGSVVAWGREGLWALPAAFKSKIVSIAISETPGLIALNSEGQVFATLGQKITSTRKSGELAVKQVVGGDNLYTPPMYQTVDGEWHLFEEQKLKSVHPEIIAGLSRLKGLAPEAFHLRLDSNPSSEAYLLWIERR